MSLFISFEGGEGSGKSTQADLLARWLVGLGFPVTLVREPGSTSLGLGLRLLLKRFHVTDRTELLLFAAARAQLVSTVIGPAIDRGRIVVADRFADSTIAYQDHGRGLSSRMIRHVNDIATRGLSPSVTYLLDLPPEQALRRVVSPGMQLSMEMAGAHGGRNDSAEDSRFEREPLEFHRRVRQGYVTLASSEPRRWVVVDATESVDVIHERICAETALRLQDQRGPSKYPDLEDLTDPVKVSAVDAVTKNVESFLCELDSQD